MLKTKYAAVLRKLLSERDINPYMWGKIKRAAESGIGDELFAHLIADAKTASSLGISSDTDYNRYFYLNNFLESVLKDFKINLNSTAGKHDFCRFFFKQGGDLNDFTDLRIFVHAWLCEGLKKQAYPNLGGGQKRLTSYNVEKWALTARQMENLILARGFSPDAAFDELTDTWDTDEKFNFQNWLRYYQQGNAEKYNLKTAKFVKQAFGPTHFNLPQSILDTRTTTTPNFYATDHKTQKQVEEEKAQAIKGKMKSRIRALKLLLDKYNDMLPHQDLDKLFSEVHQLEKSISKLNVRASIEDCVVRSANRLKKMGFIEGAEILTKEADTSVPANLNAANTAPTVTKLEDVSNRLASRDLIRALAEADIMLNNVGLAQYFPELALAQSKLIEAFGYASNKVEDVISRLRGTKTEKPEPAPLPTAPMPAPAAAPPMPTVKPEDQIKPEEFMEKPVGEVKKTL